MTTNSLIQRLCQKLKRSSSRNERRKQQTCSTNATAERLEDRQLLTIDFVFNYEGGIRQGGTGFEELANGLGLARRAALEDAADQFGQLFANTATVNIDLVPAPINNPILASAGSNFVAQTGTTTFGEIEVVRNKVVNGVDLNGTTADGTLAVDFTSTNWNLDPDPARIGVSDQDFYSAIRHELMHALGFASTAMQNGSDVFGTAPGQPALWSLYDSFLSSPSGVDVIDANGVMLTAWASDSVGGDSVNGDGLFFTGPSAMAANNDLPVGLYTPTVWSEGSSVSHLDTNNPAFTGSLMVHASPTGPGPRILTAIEEGVLIDLGYSLINAISTTETGGDTTVSDRGGTDTFSVVLGRRPTSNVVLDIINPDTSEVTTSDTQITFTPTTWDIPQTITLTGVADGAQDGNQTVSIGVSVNDAASDVSFRNFVDLFVNVTALDDDGTIPNKPVLTAPSILPATNTPTFQWSFDANAFNYDLVVTNIATGVVFQQAIGITGTSHTFAAAFPDGAYSATVQGTNAIGQTGAESDALVFSIGEPLVPAAPVIVSPQLGATTTDPRTPIVWTDVPGGFTSELYFLSGGNVTRITTPGVPDGNGNLVYTPTVDYPEGPTAVWVRTFNPFDTPGEWSSPTRFVLDAIPAPTKPVITSPLIDTTTNPFPLFSWTGDGANYELWVARRRAGTGTAQVPAVYERVIFVREHIGLSYNHFAALDNGDYRVWVRATNSAGEKSVWSDVEEFTVAVPAPATPTFFASVNSNNARPTFSWESSGAAYVPGTKFDLWVNNLSTGASQVVRDETLTGTAHQLATDLPQGRYRAWLRSKTALGTFSDWSAPVTFDIDILAPGQPTLTGPVAAADSTDGAILTETPTFTWNANPGSERFELWVNHLDSRTSRIVHETQLTGTSFTSLLNLPQGTYKAWLRGFNSAGEVGEWSSPFTFVLNVPSPSIPVITAPVANAVGTVNDATPTIGWTPSAGSVATYDLQLEDVISGNRLIDVGDIPSEQYTVLTTLEEAAYRVRVRGVNSVGETSDWSDWFIFTVDVPNATTPIPIAPTGTITNSTVTFEWAHTSGNTTYEILVRDLLRQESIVIQISTSQLSLGTNTAVYTQDGFGNGTYRWWVRGFNSQGTASSWSTSQSFNVDAQANLNLDLGAPQDELLVELTSLQVDTEKTAESKSTREVEQQLPAEPAAELIANLPRENEETSATPSSPALQAVMIEFADPSVRLIALQGSDET